MISHSKPCVGEAEEAALIKTLRSGFIGYGKQSALFEQTICKDTGYPDAIAVSSASLAIYTILKYKFPNGGGRVALSSYLCRSIWDAIKMANCIPILYDIDRETFAIDIRKIDRANINVVIVAHMFGIKAHFEEILNSGIEIIEDCAQRIVPTYIKNESKANWRVYSFDPTKLITCGQGGVIVGINKKQTKQIRELLSGRYDFMNECIKIPFTDLQASIAQAQWIRKDEFLEKRKRIANRYIERLLDHNLETIIYPAMFKKDTWHFRFIIQVEFPEKIISLMEDRNISCRKPLQPYGLHRLFSYKGSYPNTEEMTDHTLSLPLYPALNDEDIDKVIDNFIMCYIKYAS
ncbi:DegT/DnrJ/EryC1/StrS family aminotransferase [Leptospira noguchii]|uniref:DegT/DnrJ/EryC1/StrS aminotransferase family protein n=1 Tax=Leptospira noguchii TaxID=28182 RepID=M6VEQ1_9LEPT|nr:DegT/DnrJ/EryC1/StrS aminotransferase family protein [Leptospira noguchii]EMO53506.1 DegT/DnrJ/EryC1/StrS aminotransferase family protein [Leptospira noguchii]